MSHSALRNRREPSPPPMSRIALAAGGTGGHLFPALALGRELSRRERIPVLFTDARGMRLLEQGALPQGWSEERVISVAAATFSGKRGIGQYMRAGTDLCAGLHASWRALGRLRVRAAVGFGGYPSFAPVLAARLRGIPVCVHEQNAVLGRANRALAPFARVVAFALPPPVGMARAVVTGTPLREELLSLNAPYRAPSDDEDFRLLVFGGSQGARVLSRILPQALALLPVRQRARLRIVQQCRRQDLAALNQCYRQAEIRHETAPFFADLPRRMSEAHLVVARAGASTIAELAQLGRPAILLPLPGSLDSDQAQNAATVTSAKAAWTLHEGEDLAARLAQRLQSCLQHPQRLQDVAEAIRAFAVPDAAVLLADAVESMLAKTPPRGGAPAPLSPASDSSQVKRVAL